MNQNSKLKDAKVLRRAEGKSRVSFHIQVVLSSQANCIYTALYHKSQICLKGLYNLWEREKANMHML